MAVLMMAKSLLKKLEYDYSDSAVNKIVETSEMNKRNLIEHLRNSDNWNEEQKAIIFSQDFERKINQDGIKRFKDWGKGILKERVEKTAITEWYGRPIQYYIDLERKFDEIRRCIQDLQINLEYINQCKQKVEINGIDATEYLSYLHEQKERYAEIYENNEYKRDYQRYVNRKESDNLDDFGYIMDAVERNTSSFVEDELYNFIMNRIDVKIAVGMKVSKAVQKVCQFYGLDKVKVMRTVTHNGIEREKDYGYNYEYALFSDSVNTVKVKRHTIISVNPIDYWLMSNGHKWSSCHNIDKKHIIQHNSDYSGCYSGGTESYMLDSSSVIFYTVDESYDGDEFCMQEKMQRCVFCISEDGAIILQSRVYPDGRDGGDQSLATQYREVMQKVVSECWNINNQWKLKRGTSACEEYSETDYEAPHYKDYQQYEDCTVSLNKEIFDEDNFEKVNIGSTIICPVCGCWHSYEENICCEDCYTDVWHECAHCGTSIDRNDDYIYCEDNEEYYCDSECAACDGVHYCENDDNYHTERYCYKDDYDDCWYYGDPEVETKDGSNFYSSENAEDAGYRQDYDGDWYKLSELVIDYRSDEYFNPSAESDWAYIPSVDRYYLNKIEAYEDGFTDEEMEAA